MIPMDGLYWMLTLPALGLALLATLLTKATFSKYARYRASSGLTGAEAAWRLLQHEGVHDVKIEPSHGFLSDHYDPASRTLRLSPEVYGSPSLSAIGVACHEAGHALQHAKAYTALSLRTGLVPLAQLGSQLSYPLLLIGFFMKQMLLVKLGILLFGVAVLFALVTLPVEWDASARAKRLMVTSGIVQADEAAHAAKVLNAAFLTYIASAVTALMTLIYFLLRAGLLGGRRDE